VLAGFVAFHILTEIVLEITSAVYGHIDGKFCTYFSSHFRCSWNLTKNDLSLRDFPVLKLVLFIGFPLSHTTWACKRMQPCVFNTWTWKRMWPYVFIFFISIAVLIYDLKLNFNFLGFKFCPVVSNAQNDFLVFSKIQESVVFCMKVVSFLSNLLFVMRLGLTRLILLKVMKY